VARFTLRVCFAWLARPKLSQRETIAVSSSKIKPYLERWSLLLQDFIFQIVLFVVFYLKACFCCLAWWERFKNTETSRSEMCCRDDDDTVMSYVVGRNDG
jgi:hypothetical protein